MTQLETLRCEGCGGTSPADAAFCIDCGRPLSTAATGPTRRLDPPRPQVYTRPAEPAPAPAPRPRPRGAVLVPRSNRDDLSLPLLIIGAALAFLLVPRFGPMILVAIGMGGLMLRGALAHPERLLPLLALFGIAAVIFTGGKLFWPLLISFFMLRAICGGRRCW
jgi:hypothetical protein